MAKKVQRAIPDNALKDLAEKQIANTMKSIDYYVSEYTVEILAQKLSKGDFIIPEYQREFTWEHARQCKFIESILMGLPIPFLFFWERPDTGALEVVDGSQRLRTIQAFLNDSLVLDGLESLPLLNSFAFSDLSVSRQRKFNNKSIRGIILSEKADFQSRLDLFERINTGSKNANFAEVRRAALSGPFMQMIIELSTETEIVALLPASKKREDEREREELITRFFAYGDGLDDYNDKPKSFLYDYIKKMNAEFEKDSNLKSIYQKSIKNVFGFIKKHFPYGFKKTATSKTTPRARFESIAIGSYLALKKDPKLSPSKQLIDKLLNDTRFKTEIRSDGANVKSRLVGRTTITRDILLGN